VRSEYLVRLPKTESHTRRDRHVSRRHPEHLEFPPYCSCSRTTLSYSEIYTCFGGESSCLGPVTRLGGGPSLLNQLYSAAIDDTNGLH